MATYYLNNDGSRWRVGTHDQQGKFTNTMRIAIYVNGKFARYGVADFAYSLGNFYGYEFRFKGKRYRLLPSDWDRKSNAICPIVNIET